MGKITVLQDEHQVLVEMNIREEGEVIRAVISLVNTIMTMMEEEESVDSIVATYEGICSLHLDEFESNNYNKRMVTKEEMIQKKEEMTTPSNLREFRKE